MIKKNLCITFLLMQLPLIGIAKEFPEQSMQAALGGASLEQKQSATTTFQIPFKRFYSQLGTNGKKNLIEILPQLRAANSIVIQGRPDPMPSGKPSPKAMSIPQNRAMVLRKTLIAYGIPESKISLETLGEPSYTDSPEVFNATIQIFNAPSTMALSSSESVVPIASASQLNPMEKSQGLSAYSVRKVLKTAMDNNLSATDTGRLFESWLAIETPAAAQRKLVPGDSLVPLANVRRVLKTAIDNNLSATDASRMFESWMAVEYAKLPTTPANLATEPIQSRQAPPSAETVITQFNPAQSEAPLASQTPAQTPAKQWRLEPGRTLRDNLNDWAREAGWNQPQWAASQSYRITHAATYDGQYPDVLRKISDQSKLNVCVRKFDKVVKITDSNTSCKE